MKRGEIWWVNFDPSIGSEIKKTRPAIIISNDLSNNALEVIQVIPLTSNIKKLFPNEAFIQTKEKSARALAHQITTISKKRINNKMGAISKEEMKALENAIKLQLGF